MLKIFQNKLFFIYLSVLTLAFSLYFFQPFILNDFYLHINMGKWIALHNMEVPNYAVMNWYGEQENLPWIAHEWLSEVIFYYIYSFFNYSKESIIILVMSICMVLLVSIIKINKDNIILNFTKSYVYLLSLTLTTFGFFVFRPQIFSFLLFFIEIYIIYNFYYNKRYNSIFIIPVISCLWSNLHGGSSSLSYYLLIGLIVFSLIPLEKIGLEKKFKKEKIPLNAFKKVVISTILSILAICINPNGISMLFYPYINMNDTLMLSFIREWFPLNINDTSHIQLCFPILIIVYFYLFLSNKKIDILDFCYLLVFTFMTFKSGRFIMYFALASSFSIFKYMNDECKKEIKNLSLYTKNNIKITCFTIFILIIASLYCLHSDKFLKADDEIIKSHVLQTVISEHPQRIFNWKMMGEELPFYGIKPFIDNRADVFTKYNWIDGIELEEGLSNPEVIIAKYQFDYILISKNSPLNWYLKMKPGRFELIDKDDFAVLYKVISTKNHSKFNGEIRLNTSL